MTFSLTSSSLWPHSSKLLSIFSITPNNNDGINWVPGIDILAMNEQSEGEERRDIEFEEKHAHKSEFYESMSNVPLLLSEKKCLMRTRSFKVESFNFIQVKRHLYFSFHFYISTMNVLQRVWLYLKVWTLLLLWHTEQSLWRRDFLWKCTSIILTRILLIYLYVW
jgi:hypothetical protein